MNTIDFYINTEDFQKAMREYAELSRREDHEIVTKIAKDVAYQSASASPKTTKGRIRSDLIQSVGGSTLKVYKIINAHRRDVGKKPLWGKYMGDASRALISRRQASIGFLRVGWADIILDLGGSYRGRKSKQGKLGRGIKAHATLNPTAELYYYIPSKQFGKSGSKLLSMAQAALSSGISAKTQDLVKEVERRLAQRARKISAA